MGRAGESGAARGWLLAGARWMERMPRVTRAQRHRHLRLRRHQVKARAVYVGLAP